MMNMTEFTEKLKKEVREYLPEDVKGVDIHNMTTQALHAYSL